MFVACWVLFLVAVPVRQSVASSAAVHPESCRFVSPQPGQVHFGRHPDPRVCCRYSPTSPQYRCALTLQPGFLRVPVSIRTLCTLPCPSRTIQQLQFWLAVLSRIPDLGRDGVSVLQQPPTAAAGSHVANTRPLAAAALTTGTVSAAQPRRRALDTPRRAPPTVRRRPDTRPRAQRAPPPPPLRAPLL